MITQKAPGLVQAAHAALEYHRAQIAHIEEFLGKYGAALEARQPRKRIDTPALLDAIEEILFRNKRAMNRTEIWRSLQQTDLELPQAANPERNLGTLLWRSKRFDNFRGKGYYPRSAPYPTKDSKR